MDLTDMADDILVSMARAVENSYIVLLCINQQYYESDYCRLGNFKFSSLAEKNFFDCRSGVCSRKSN